MSVRAKFIVYSLKQLEGASEPTIAVRLQAALDGDENKSWAKYTPHGDINITISNPAAAEQFEVGRSYFVDFTPAD